MGKIRLSEGTDEFKSTKKEWSDEARKCTIETLPAFLTKLTQNYQHDYGTICHAVAVAATAAAWAVDRTPTGGITGFQAGAIMWEFIREWNCSDNKTGMRLVDYDNFLYPQYSDKFEKVLSKDVWANLQKAADVKLAEADADHAKYLLNLEQYRADIAAFVAKYPDYYERKGHYDPLGMGTGEQWEAERQKRDSGFEFAPQEPHCFITSDSRVYRHWQSIVDGVVPFGYTVGSD